MLRLKLSCLLLSLTALACLATPPRTLRVDYGHTGAAASEHFGVDRVVLEPLPWPGDLGKAVDDSNLGKYCFEVTDRTSGKLLYTRGFSSIYGEWETTDEAKALSRTFSESLRFPTPEGPVRILVKKRDAQNAFKVIWTFDESSPTTVSSVTRSARTSRPPVTWRCATTTSKNASSISP